MLTEKQIRDAFCKVSADPRMVGLEPAYGDAYSAFTVATGAKWGLGFKFPQVRTIRGKILNAPREGWFLSIEVTGQNGAIVQNIYLSCGRSATYADIAECIEQFIAVE